VTSDPANTPPPGASNQQLQTHVVVVFYLIMGLIAYGLGFLLADRNIFHYDASSRSNVPIDVTIGALAGLSVVGLSRLFEWLFEWARQLSHAMRHMLGPLDSRAILFWAIFSALGEEMLFRGLLQPNVGLVLSSIGFGLLHIGPDRRYLPWTVMAIAMGFAFGAMYGYTGNLLAPIIAHFTINFFNLHALANLEPSSNTLQD